MARSRQSFRFKSATPEWLAALWNLGAGGELIQVHFIGSPYMGRETAKTIEKFRPHIVGTGKLETLPNTDGKVLRAKNTAMKLPVVPCKVYSILIAAGDRPISLIRQFQNGNPMILGFHDMTVEWEDGPVDDHGIMEIDA